MRGWGLSQDLSGEWQTAFSRDRGEHMDHLEIARAVLVGQSMGGSFVLPFAARNPERVAALMMACTAVGIGDEAILEELQASPVASFATRKAWMTQMFGSAYVERSPEGASTYNQIRALNPPPANVSGYGVNDGTVTNDELADLIPHARYIEVPTAGHSVYWELPDEFNHMLQELSAEAYG